MTTKTIHAFGPSLIAQQAQTLINQNSSDASEQNRPLSKNTEAVMDLLADDSFLETMLYATRICEEYEGIQDDFESSQREREYEDCDDWREGVTSGLRQVTQSAILTEAQRILTDDGLPVTPSLERTEEYEYNPEKIEREATKLTTLKEKFSLTPETGAMDVVKTQEVKAIFESNTGFMYQLLILNELTEAHDIKMREEMADTAVREGIANNGFIEGVEENLPREIMEQVGAGQADN